MVRGKLKATYNGQENEICINDCDICFAVAITEKEEEEGGTGYGAQVACIGGNGIDAGGAAEVLGEEILVMIRKTADSEAMRSHLTMRFVKGISKAMGCPVGN